jgi:hypothetical protein
MRKFETFFYNPSVAVQMENESLRNVVILLCQKDENEDENEDCHPEGTTVDRRPLSVDKNIV